MAAMLYVLFPLSLHNVEQIPHERDIDVGHEAIWFSQTILVLCKQSSGSIHFFDGII
jgi:hypothetical protein